MKKGLNSNDFEYIGEPKLDGLAVELIYENGYFKASVAEEVFDKIFFCEKYAK